MHPIAIKDAEQMKNLGACLANYVQPANSLWLQGPLGAGKTTLCQGLIRALGYQHPIKSPTFTLVNSYTIGKLLVHHFDFYRITDPYEFDLIGGPDYFTDNSFCVIEWPERATAMLPPPTLSLSLALAEDTRQVQIKSDAEHLAEKIIEDFES